VTAGVLLSWERETPCTWAVGLWPWLGLFLKVGTVSKGAFTRVPQVDQRGWFNEIEFNG
jgi:hypothetical protein